MLRAVLSIRSLSSMAQHEAGPVDQVPGPDLRATLAAVRLEFTNLRHDIQRMFDRLLVQLLGAMLAFVTVVLLVARLG